MIVTALPVQYHAVRTHLAGISEDEHSEGDVYERGLFYAGERLWEVGIVEMGVGNPQRRAKDRAGDCALPPGGGIVRRCGGWHKRCDNWRGRRRD